MKPIGLCFIIVLVVGTMFNLTWIACDIARTSWIGWLLIVVIYTLFGYIIGRSIQIATQGKNTRI